MRMVIIVLLAVLVMVVGFKVRWEEEQPGFHVDIPQREVADQHQSKFQSSAHSQLRPTTPCSLNVDNIVYVEIAEAFWTLTFWIILKATETLVSVVVFVVVGQRTRQVAVT